MKPKPSERSVVGAHTPTSIVVLNAELIQLRKKHREAEKGEEKETVRK